MVSIRDADATETRRGNPRIVVPEIVEEQVWIELDRVAEPERALQLHAGAFPGWAGVQHLPDGTDRHGIPFGMNFNV